MCARCANCGFHRSSSWRLTTRRSTEDQVGYALHAGARKTRWVMHYTQEYGRPGGLRTPRRSTEDQVGCALHAGARKTRWSFFYWTRWVPHYTQKHGRPGGFRTTYRSMEGPVGSVIIITRGKQIYTIEFNWYHYFFLKLLLIMVFTIIIKTCRHVATRLHPEWPHKQSSCFVCWRYQVLFSVETHWFVVHNCAVQMALRGFCHA